MTAIVCVSQSWGIGRDGALLFRISADHKRFRTLTVGGGVLHYERRVRHGRGHCA